MIFMPSQKILMLLSLMLLSISMHAQWLQVSDFPGDARDDLVAFSCQNRAFAGTGINTAYEVTNDFYEYLPASNQWVPIPNLPGIARQYAFSFSFSNLACVYAGIDQAGSALKDGFLFNPNLQNWSSISQYPGNGSRGCAAAVLGAVGYAGLGRDANNLMQNDWWQYRLDNNNWVQKASFPGVARNLSACFESNGYIYVLGGIDANDMAYNDIWQYNPDSDTWIEMTIVLPEALGSMAHCKVKHSGVMIGGYNGQNLFTDQVLMLDAFNELMLNITAIPINAGRKGAKAFVLNDEVYITCGLNSGNTRLKTTWKYTQINSIQTNELNNKFIAFYPNPAAQRFEIIFRGDNQKIYTKYCILKHDGTEIKTGNISTQNTAVIIDTHDLPNGFYLVKIYNEKEMFVEKILICH